MRSNKHLLPILLMMIVVAALYRIIPDRQPGFVPHLAMALFAGAVIKDRKWAFAFPIFSMFISDALYQLLYTYGLTTISGFYAGQITNYLLFAGITAIGFLMRKINVLNVVLYSFIVCISYFLVSNFFVWNSGAGYSRPHTMAGLIQCYVDALPFLEWNLVSTLIFSGALFGAWRVINAKKMAPAIH